MIIANIIAFVLVLIGCLNWGIIGIFNWNFVTAIFGAGMTVGGSIIYILILLAALWLIGYAIYSRGLISLRVHDKIK
jgi:uncharacterized membrane protein YuzA (DUF378 family)